MQTQHVPKRLPARSLRPRMIIPRFVCGPTDEPARLITRVRSFDAETVEIRAIEDGTKKPTYTYVHADCDFRVLVSPYV